MARKELIYAVDKTTNEVVRVSKSYQAALEFQASSRENAKSLFLCTSEVTLKKGDVMAFVKDVL